MKKLIFKKFAKDIFQFFLLVSLSISLIVWVIQAVNFLDIVTEDGHGFRVYFLYTLLSLPKIFSKILPFIYFVSIFYIILKYENNNELIIFWTIGIKKLDFVNVLLIFSIFYLILQLLLTTFVVPRTLDKARSYIRSSNLDLYSSIMQEKKFIDAVKNLTIFIEEKNDNRELKNIFLKEKIKENEYQIIFAKKGIINKLIKKNIRIFSLNLLPRITRAQSMDVLSSQANLAGYRAVIESGEEFGKAVPMMMTAAGTITPAKVLVIGAGVAGLQAIATAKRLGAVVSATDVRTVAKEQVESLGGKFLTVEGAENLETSGGYAKEAGEDFKKKQAELLKNSIKKNDIVICTALIPGKKAPRIISEEMVKSMKSGSIIYDLAVGQGGNSAFSEADKVNVVNGVKVMGAKNILNNLALTASSLYAKNLFNFVNNLYDKEKKDIYINKEDEIISKTLINKEL